ncbi:glycoside hydrolase family 65 protein [Solitalea longa]|nr:glycoside hydrolase family 65 protein [Solitalea longa]
MFKYKFRGCGFIAYERNAEHPAERHTELPAECHAERSRSVANWYSKIKSYSKSAFCIVAAVLLSAINVKAQVDPWIIKADKIDPSNYYGVSVANGMVGIVSSPEPFKVKNIVLAGAYDLYGRGRVSNFINGINLLNMGLSVDGKSISANNISNFTQQLNMKNGSFTTSFNVGEKATVNYTVYSLRHLPYSVMVDVSVSAKQDVEIGASNSMETPDALRDAQNYFNEIVRSHVAISLLTTTAKSPTGKIGLAASTTFLFDEPKDQQPNIIHAMYDNNRHSMRFTKKIQAGTTYSYAIAGAVLSTAHHPDPLNETERLAIFAKMEGKQRLISLHNKAWDDLWKSDILIEGDDQAQQDVRSMLYHLYAFSRAGSGMSLSPMGLSGLGYNGHVFWDTDTWMFPPLLVLHPEIAESLIDYRFKRLEVAKQNAFSHGYKGAMFPWESAESGAEETPVWALSGPFEHHITGCVAFATWSYYCVTQDKEWLKNKGWPIIEATADFWASRVERNGPGKFDIKNVVASDEWAENVDNDAFTNAIAKANLEIANQAAKLLGKPENADWSLVAKNIPIHQFPDGVTREHATYNGEPIKQADVNLLAYPLKRITNEVQIKKDLEYYQTRVPVSGTPAMTQAIFSLLYARLGDEQQAYHYFQDAFIPNLNPPFRVIAETKGGTNPYFATGAGGVLQAVLMGFGGLDITPKGIQQVKSKLPAHWKSLTIKGVGPAKATYLIKK